MKNYLQTLGAALTALAMVALPVAAQHRGNGGGRNSHSPTHQTQPSARPTVTPSQSTRPSARPTVTPSQSNRPSARPTGRPSIKPNDPTQAQRPATRPTDNSGYRPGNGGNHRPDNGNVRPGNNGNHRPDNGGYRPGNGGNHRPDNGGYRPGGNHRPDHGGYRPGGGSHHRPAPRPLPAGHRHAVPFFGHYHRPLPPPSWRPRRGFVGPSFGTVLGITFGTALNLSINTLINDGYNVTGYGDNVVYLTNVPQMNFYWPDAALYYNNGALCWSTFTYPSTYYDMSRYNTLYNIFCRQYGAPVSALRQGGVISASWFGAGNRYVTLEFNSNYGNYYTTLNFGL